MRKLAVVCCVCALGLWVGARAKASPPDVRTGHWAAHAVDEVLQNGLLTLSTDHKFHGEAKVTRNQAATALASLARKLEADKWQALPSSPVPASVTGTLKRGDWKQRPVTRYILASVLARFGDYFTRGITRAPADAKDTGKSVLIADMAKPALSPKQAANPALAYLAAHHEMFTKSPLLKQGDVPITGEELSQAVAEMVIGLNDKLTSLGLDENGGTPDKTFHQPKGAPKPPH